MFHSPTRIVFGVNSTEEVGKEAKRLGGKKALILTSPTPEKLGLVDKVKTFLEREKFMVEIFNEVSPEPTLQMANVITDIVRKQTYDVIVGVGGGSVMDIAKVVSIMATNPGDVGNYLGIGLVEKPGLPKILIPTTAGTGSEVTQGAVLTSEGNCEKVSIISNYVRADVALVDPLMSINMPPELTASTGIDALSHAIEAYMSLNASVISDTLALKAVELIANSLPAAFLQGSNLEARYNMSLAALMGGMVVDPVNAGACAGHAAAYAFAAKYKIPHGISVSITLPYIMEYNMSACLAKFKAISRAFGERVEEMAVPEAASKAVARVRRLIGETLKLPTQLRDIGIPREAIPELAEKMLITRLLASNPLKITKEDAKEIFKKMW